MVGPARPTEARITGFSFTPYTPHPVGSEAPPSRPGTRGGNRGLVQFLTDIRTDSSPESLHARGVGSLVHDGKVEQAVALLELAASQEPRNARIQSDLAAAYFARAERRDDPADLLPALAAARHAVELDGGLLEARFNLALGLEKLHLADASRAWRDYLVREDSAEWQDEALAHLAKLILSPPVGAWDEARFAEAAREGDLDGVREITRSYQKQVRDFAELALLPNWADHHAEGRPEEAEQILETARTAGQALAEIGGDFLIADSVSAIEEAGPDPDRLAKLAEGHRAYGAGLFERAAGRLGEAETPFVALAVLNGANGSYQRQRYDATLAALAPLLSPEIEKRYPDLFGRAAGLQGLVRAATGEGTGALHAYRSAQSAFERAGETERIGAVQSLLAEYLLLLGDLREAWKFSHSALAATRRSKNPDRLVGVLDIASKAALRLDQPEIALDYLDQAVHLTATSGDTSTLLYALLPRSSVLYRLGRTEEAERDLKQAWKALEGVDPKIRDRAEADLSLAEAELALRDDPARAVEFLTRGLDVYRRAGAGVLVAPLLLTRARARLILGDDESAEADLVAAIQAVEHQRGTVEEESLRISYLDDSEDAYQEMVRLQIRRRRPEQAFDFAERGRSRTLLDRLGDPGGAPLRPLGALEARRTLPPKTALVQFSVLADESLAWVLTRERIELVRIAAGADELGERIEPFRAAVESGRGKAALAPLSANLYRILAVPLLRSIPEDTLVVLVPDGPLHQLPFASLVDPESGGFLIEQRNLAFAPSATLYAAALKRDGALAGGGMEDLLLVGDPAFDTEVFSLRRLPHAAKEAREIRTLYPSSELLIYEAATKERFLASAGRHAIVHYAGHTEVNPESPALSRLVLAGPGEGAALYSEEVYRSRLDRTRLVLLASCSTAAGRPSRSEGVISLARSFLAAGVPAVVATSWQIEDDAAAQLFTAFHRHLRAGQTIPVALRSAQLELLRSNDPALRSPANWAGVGVIGGVRQQPQM